MDKVKKFVDGVRSALRRAYADQNYVGLLPTRQVLVAAVVYVVVAGAQALLGIDVTGPYVEGAAALLVAYLIGPPAKPEDVATAKALGVIEGLNAAFDEPLLESKPGGDTKLPDVPGEFVGPSDTEDPDKPGQVI